MICNTIPMMKIYVNKSMKFGEIVRIVLKTLRSPVGRMTSHPGSAADLSGAAMPLTAFDMRTKMRCRREETLPKSSQRRIKCPNPSPRQPQWL